jgi:drug/metabolite transporter (DMT)-like permease
MLLGFVTTLLATVCYSVASVLQAVGSRRLPAERQPGLRLLRSVAQSRHFLMGTALDVAAFGLVAIALHRLPLFVVQASTGGSLAVTAAAAVWLLGARLTRRDVAGIAAVAVGLGLLALSSGPEGSRVASRGFHLGLLVATGVLALVSLPLGRLHGRAVTAALGLLSGTAFGAVSLSVRVLDHSSAAAMATDYATYAVVVGGLCGYLCYALALQRGSVTVATAAVILGETLLPGLIGVALLGDRARPGAAWSAVAGFVLAVGGTFVLARFGEVELDQAQPPGGGSRRAVAAMPPPGPSRVRRSGGTGRVPEGDDRIEAGRQPGALPQSPTTHEVERMVSDPVAVAAVGPLSAWVAAPGQRSPWTKR